MRLVNFKDRGADHCWNKIQEFLGRYLEDIVGNITDEGIFCVKYYSTRKLPPHLRWFPRMTGPEKFRKYWFWYDDSVYYHEKEIKYELFLMILQQIGFDPIKSHYKKSKEKRKFDILLHKKNVTFQIKEDNIHKDVYKATAEFLKKYRYHKVYLGVPSYNQTEQCKRFMHEARDYKEAYAEGHRYLKLQGTPSRMSASTCPKFFTYLYECGYIPYNPAEELNKLKNE